MKLTSYRLAHGTNSTMSALMCNGVFHSFVCEDEHRDVKVHGETRIPAGTYKIKLRAEGSMHAKYLQKFPGTHRGMLWLQGVPGFEWVYIHIGNSEKDSLGCLLVGYGAFKGPDGGGYVSDSGQAYLDLYRKIIQAMDSGEEVSITIHDSVGV